MSVLVNADLRGRFTDDALQELSKLPGVLKLSLPVLTPKQATILSNGSFTELRLQVREVGTEALLALADYNGKLTLLDHMHHHRALQPYMLLTQQIASYGLDWEPESILLAHKMPQDEIAIRTTKQPTLEQLESIRQYKGRLGINMYSLEDDCKEHAEVPEDCPEPEPPVELTQEMVNVLSTSQAISFVVLEWCQ